MNREPEKKKIKRKSFDIRFYEDLVKARPNFTEALVCLGDLYTKEGFITEGLQVDLQLSRLKPRDPIVCYNLSCSFSLSERLDEALDALKKAILFGYKDFSHLLKDKDLANLRKDARFEKLLQKIHTRLGVGK